MTGARHGRHVRVLGVALCAAAMSCGSDPVPPNEFAPEGFEPAAVFGIAAEPGPSEASITITWSSVSLAGAYALYFSTNPEVSPETGTRIAGISSGFVHSDLDPNSKYYYIVAGLNGDVEGPPSVEVSATPKHGIGLRVEQPTAGALVAIGAPIVVAVTSARALSSLVVFADAASAPLSFDASIGRWTGTLPFTAADPPSARMVRLVATDVQSTSAEANAFVRYDNPPVVTVTAPVNEAVASPSVRIVATCADDGRLGCTEFVAYVAGSRSAPLAGGTASIDATVSLAQFGAGDVQIIVEGVDSAGQVVRVTRVVRRE